MFSRRHDPNPGLCDRHDRRPDALPGVEQSAIWDLANKVCDRYFRSPPNTLPVQSQTSAVPSRTRLFPKKPLRPRFSKAKDRTDQRRPPRR
jgi:hypothetical protein